MKSAKKQVEESANVFEHVHKEHARQSGEMKEKTNIDTPEIQRGGYTEKAPQKEKRAQKRAFVYILLCADGSLYSGFTFNVEKRLTAHNGKKGAKYTRGRLPVKLVYKEACASMSEALKRELEIKRLPRKKKQELIENYSEG